MRPRHSQDALSKRTGDTFTLERESGPDVKPFAETDARAKPLVAFEALQVSTTPTPLPETWGSSLS